MSDEPNTNDNGAEWTMPEPVFRSSEGRTPKSSIRSEADDIDTESPDFDESDADDIDTEIPNRDVSSKTQSDISDEIATAIAEEMPVYDPKPKGGCAKSVMMIVGVIVFLAVSVIITAVYFLYYLKPAETGPF